MSKHTPGPWGIGDSDLPVSQLAVMSRANTGRKHSTIARVVNPDFVGMTPFEGEANARLIAAAPELLAACRIAVLALAALQPTCPTLIREYEIVSAAIAKATRY